jgi:NAD(P)-dependent dehydrogenase (short-subunit alcohol dehydrogenase family)
MPVVKRVVIVASDASRGLTVRFDDLQSERQKPGFGPYKHSKLLNLLFMAELARRWPGVPVHAMHPGTVSTEICRASPPMAAAMKFLGALRLVRSPAQGAKTAVWLATDPALESSTGRYFIDQREVQPTAAALDVAAQRRLWDESERLIQAALLRAAA